MKIITIVLVCALASFGAQAKGSGGSHRIAGHVTKKGTYVAPSHAKNPNESRRDNYSSKGNVNPYTGKAGTKDPNAPKK